MADIKLSSLGAAISFTVVTSSGGSKTAEFATEFPAGVYTIYSIAGDTDLEIYLGAADGSNVGYSTNGNKAIIASAPFKYVTTANANSFDAIVFEQYEISSEAATLATKTNAFWAPPTVTNVSPSSLPNVNDTTTITGTNFATDVSVKFRKSDDTTLVNAKSIVRGSDTSIVATRPDVFAVGDGSYDVVVTNTSTNLSGILTNAITSGAVPVWVTSTTLNSAQIGSSFSQTIQATDADGGSSIVYAIVSGALQTGLSLNTSTGVISGTVGGSEGTANVTISATDSGGNAVNRAFTQVIEPSAVSVEYLVIAGGGAGDYGGGGGAGGMRTGTLQIALSTPLTTTIGAGGSGGKNNSTVATNSVFSTISTTAGGVNGANGATTRDGGSGSGQYQNQTVALGNKGNYSPVEGYNGSRGNYYGATGGGGGAGGAATDGSGTSGGIGGPGRSSSITGTAVTYAGGGGGGMGDVDGNGSSGGSGGGGTGGGWGYNSGRPGPTNATFYGAGGGGQGYAQDKNGGNGYQGLVILKYPDNKTLSSSGMTLSTSSSAGYKITTITAGNGTVTFT